MASWQVAGRRFDPFFDRRLVDGPVGFRHGQGMFMPKVRIQQLHAGSRYRER
jgi:hypothetical protein